MHDPEIENLLRRYRPVGPTLDLERQITKSPNHQITQSPDLQVTRSPATWPWAVAAAALLAITIGLHAAVVSPPGEAGVVDADRVRLLAEELGASRESRAVAEWLAMREARAEQDRLARAAAPLQDRQ